MAYPAIAPARSFRSERLLVTAVVLHWLGALLGFMRVADGTGIGIVIPSATFALVVEPVAVWYFAFRRGHRWPGVYLAVVGTVAAVAQVSTDDPVRYGVLGLSLAAAACALAWLRRPAPER